MSDETAPVETWAAEAETLYRDGIAVGTLISADFAEWVAEACETLDEMDKAQAEWEASGEAAHCSMVDIGSEQMRIQGGADMPEPLRDAMADVVGAARRAMAEAKAAERAEIERAVRAQCAAELEAVEDLAARQRQDHRAELAEAEAQIQALGVHLDARDHALRFVSEHAELAKAELDRLKTVVATFREYLDHNFRQWCSPHGFADGYATKLIAELDQLTALDPPGEQS